MKLKNTITCKDKSVTQDGEDKPNKGYYDPRKWLRAGQEAMIARLEVAYSDLCSINKN